MLIRRELSGKHVLLWVAALLALAIAIVLGALLLRALVRHPTLGSASAARDVRVPVAELRSGFGFEPALSLRSSAQAGPELTEHGAERGEHFRAAAA